MRVSISPEALEHLKTSGGRMAVDYIAPVT